MVKEFSHFPSGHSALQTKSSKYRFVMQVVQSVAFL